MNRFSILILATVLLVSASVGAKEKEPAPPPPKPPLVLTLDDPKAFPNAPGFFTVKGKVKEGNNPEFPIAFGINFPTSYFASKEPFGLLITMHNVVEAAGGSDGGDGLHGEGPGALMVNKDWVDDRRSGTVPEKPVDIKKYVPLICIMPQTPKDKDFDRWPMNGVIIRIIDEVAKYARVDLDRVYLTGFSHGGSCTWRVAEEFPDRFAAIAPMSGRVTPNPAYTADRLKNVPCWMGYGDQDADWAIPDGKAMCDAMTKVKPADFQCTVVKGGNHFCYYNIMKDQKFWDWLLPHRRGPPKPPPKPPAGPNLAKVKPELAEPYDAKLLAKLKDVVAKNPGFAYKSPTYKDTAKIKSIDAQGMLNESVGPIEMKTQVGKLSYHERIALLGALPPATDEDSVAMLTFYTLAAGDKVKGEELLKKCGSKTESLKDLFFPPLPMASPGPGQ